MRPLSIRSEVRSQHQDFWEPDPMTRRSTTGKGTRCGERGRSTGSTLTPSGPEDLATVLLETVWTYHIPRVLRQTKTFSSGFIVNSESSGKRRTNMKH